MRPVPALLLLAALLPAADERGTADTGHGNEAEDADTIAGPVLGRELADSLGAIPIRFTMPDAGEATLALYDQHGRLVRTCAQLVPLPAGEHTFRWDGLDQWGNQLPAGTKVTAKLFHSPGLKALYEFSVAEPTPERPWPGTTGGDRPLAGGWLGDHSAPELVLGLKDRVILACGMAEYGSAIIAVDRDGRKIWGTDGVMGWTGPKEMAGDDRDVYLAHDRQLWRMDPATGRRTGLPAAPAKIQRMAVSGTHLLALYQDEDGRVPAIRGAAGQRSISPGTSLPVQPDSPAPTEFSLSRHGAFTQVFTGPGWHRDVGTSMVAAPWGAFVVLTSDRPMEVGSLLLERLPGAARWDVHALAEGLAFDPTSHLPDAEVSDLMPEGWQPFGSAAQERAMTLVAGPGPGVKTRALLVRALRPDGAGGEWKPGLRMARLQARRLAIAAPTGKVILPGSATPVGGRAAPPGAAAWDARVPEALGADRPGDVIIDYGAAQTFRAVAFLNLVNADALIQAWTGEGTPDAAVDAGWSDLGRLRGGSDKRQGSLAAPRYANERWLSLDKPVSARAIRVRATAGWEKSRFGGPDGGADPRRIACDEVLLVRTLDHLPEDDAEPKPMIAAWPRAGGPPATAAAHLAIEAMAGLPDGGVLAAGGGALHLGRPGPDGWRWSRFGGESFARPRALAVTGDAIAVTDSERGLVLLDRQGGAPRVVSSGVGRPTGAWDARRVHVPTGVGFGPDGSVWVAERAFSPKRVVRFARDGKVLGEFFGPPMYGGGGYLHPDLKRFFYKGVMHAVDFAAGTSRLTALYETLRSQEGMAPEQGSFSFTGIEAPRVRDGRTYLIGGGGQVSIGILVDGVLRPAAVVGTAQNSPFLLTKDVWKAHWARQDLAGKVFAWSDRNGDGQFQIPEVELAPSSTLPGDAARGITGGSLAPDWAIWGRDWRLPVAEWTAGGAPVYRLAGAHVLAAVADAPEYRGAMSIGGPRSAKPGLGWATTFTKDGLRLREGQPYLLKPDGTWLGQGPLPKATDWQPPIAGGIMNQPLGFVGSAPVEGPVGDVAVMNGNNGHWYAVALPDAVVVGAFFTGADGQFGAQVPAVRGADVTRYKQHWETFFGHFLRADDGRHYVVAGKGWHGIHRITGLESIRTSTVPVEVPAASMPVNAALRAAQARRQDVSKRPPGPRELGVPAVADRAPRFRVDGRLADWGGPGKLEPMANVDGPYALAAARSDNGLVIALAGKGSTGHAGGPLERAASNGFGIEISLRTEARNRAAGIAQGDRRLILTPLPGDRWRAVRIDYWDPAVPPAQSRQLRSPWGDLQISRLVEVDAKTYTVGFELGQLDLESIEAAPATPEGPDELRVGGANDGDDLAKWSFEVELTWAALGLPGKPGALRADVAVLEADAAGTRTVNRVPWAEPVLPASGDTVYDLRPRPGSWGVWHLP